MIVGCYTMDLYCCAPGCPVRPVAADTGAVAAMATAQFTGETASMCRHAARLAGWKLYRGDGGGFEHAKCSRCVKDGR